MATSTLGNGTLVLAGTTSGTTTVTATAVAGTTTLTLPAATDTLVGKATTDTLTNKTLTGAVMNGTLGATTPSTGAFTTTTASTSSSATIFYPTVTSGTGIQMTSTGNNNGNWTIANNYGQMTVAIEGTAGSLVTGSSQGAALFGNSSNVPVQFFTNNTVRATLDTSGNLLAGTPSAISSLTERLAVKVASGNLTPISTSVPSNANRYQIEFYTPSGLAGYVLTNTLVTSYTSVSDYRLKENITPMAGALARVSQLKPVTYKWKTDGSDGQGFIAHELAEVCSDAVTGIKDAVNEDGSIKPQGVDTSFLVATLTAAIQEMKAIIDTQASTITQLTARITALESA